MKKISIVIPTYNEEKNIEPLYQTLTAILKTNLSIYDYEIIFIDNYSLDHTRELIKKICQKDKKVKAIFNAKNFGYLRSPYYGVIQSSGDCTILMSADFQDPPELIPEFINKWESGYKIVIGKKTSSEENKFIYFLRSLYYKIIKKISDTEQIEQFTCFGLYDKSFVKVLSDLEDSRPYMRGIVAELGYKRAEVEFKQPLRKHGKSSSNLKNLYDQAMLGITSYTKIGIRCATFIGLIFTFLAIIISLSATIQDIVKHTFSFTKFLISIISIGVGISIIFIGIIGEYILNMNIRLMKRPLVVEETRINF